VRGPIIATTLVMMAVFVPMAFIPGMTGQLYNQFALTIAISVGLSAFNSLTLSPALCAVLLRPASGKKKNILFRGFNHAFEALSSGYGRSVQILARIWVLGMLVFAGLCVVAFLLLRATPTAFVPEEDQGYFMTLIQLPSGSTIGRTKAVVTDVAETIRQAPGVAATLAISGYNIIDGIKQPDAGLIFVILEPFAERQTPETKLRGIIGGLRPKLNDVSAARVLMANAPAIPGLGATGGFTFELQDLNAQGMAALAKVADNFIAEARKSPELSGIYTTFNPSVPQRFLQVDRLKAQTRGVSVTDIFNVLQVNLGSVYVNDFNKYGKVYRVYVQAEKDARDEDADIGRLKVMNKDGEMIPLNSFVKVEPFIGPYNIPHYNKYNAIAVNGDSAPGFSSGQAVQAMESLAAEVLPEGYGYEWTGITYQQLKAGDLAPLVFALSLLFVFLVLAAQYESWVMPVMILMAIPFGVLGAAAGLFMLGIPLNVYGQIGLVMLIGLVAKNSILIVEFARETRDKGADILEAAKHAAEMRLRPILMTALAFIIGLSPLVAASGAGAAARVSLGITVVSGLAVATFLIILVPLFYYVLERMREAVLKKPAPKAETAKTASPAPEAE